MVMVLAVALAVPAMAQTVTTGVNVLGGVTTPPIIKAKWERDLTSSREDGDPSHLVPGSQFLPSGQFEVDKIVEYWVIVTDPDGVNTIDQVTVDVYHPAGPPENGSWKYQLILSLVDKVNVGIPAYVDAVLKGLVTYQVDYNNAEILDELDKSTAQVYMATADLDYHQPAGNYTVVADAYDGGKWGADGDTDLSNTFLYKPVGGMEVDFNGLDYGDVVVSNEKWIAGDVVWNTPIGAAPIPNRATVRNIGNTDIKITVRQTDMGFGYSGTGVPTAYSGSTAPTNINTTPSSFQSSWNVVFDARMGSLAANAMYYDPNVTVTLPNELPLCNTDELDFSIHIYKSQTTPHAGTMTLGFVVSPF
jgi:hypothetical protein